MPSDRPHLREPEPAKALLCSAARSAFASGSVLEEPAIGEVEPAALDVCVRDLRWPHGGDITIDQGEDMGQASRIQVTIGPDVGAPVTVGGAAHPISP